MAQENVNVVARIRPLSNETNDETCIAIDPVSSVITLTTKQKQFRMDKVFEQNATQEEIFEHVKPMIAAVINGIHGTIFAYGQTGSGKTHTMIGSDDKNHGIIPRAIEMIFDAFNEESKNRTDNFKFKISFTALQIYCEKTYDLLNGNEKIEIPLSDILKNAKEVEVNSSNECMEILKFGLKQRKVAGTSMNETSSRSHAILTLTLKTEYFKENKKHERISRLNMVDLAGSEKHTENNITQNREAANINKSLATLGQVIRAIINPTPQKFIPYRDSKLTTLLRDSLGGNSKTTVIVNIHTNSEYATETYTTLNFAVTVKEVKNTTILQEYITSTETLSLKAEVQRLDEQNHKLITELAKEKEKVVQLKRTVDQKDNKITTLEKESFELEEDKSKLELELEKANEKRKKCEIETKQMINGLQNGNNQLKEKVHNLETGHAKIIMVRRPDAKRRQRHKVSAAESQSYFNDLFAAANEQAQGRVSSEDSDEDETLLPSPPQNVELAVPPPPQNAETARLQPAQNGLEDAEAARRQPAQNLSEDAEPARLQPPQNLSEDAEAARLQPPQNPETPGLQPPQNPETPGLQTPQNGSTDAEAPRRDLSANKSRKQPAPKKRKAGDTGGSFAKKAKTAKAKLDADYELTHGVDFLISRRRMYNLLKELFQRSERGRMLKLQNAAVDVFRTAAEFFLISYFEDLSILACHAKRRTIMKRDSLALRQLKPSLFKKY